MPTTYRYFVRCDMCNKPIYIGERFYAIEGLCGIYCSCECFTDASCALVKQLEFEDCDNSGAQVFKLKIEQVVVDKVIGEPIGIAQAELNRLIEESKQAK